MAKNWRRLMGELDLEVDDINEVIALRVPKGAIRSLLQKDVIVNPGEVAVLVKDGKIEDILTQSKLKKFGGGIKGWIEDLMGKGEDEYLIFIDTTDQTIDFPIKETSKDRVEIHGVCTFRFSINAESAQNLINVMKDENVLTLDDLRGEIEPELKGTFSNKVSDYTAEEFHGNREIVSDIEEDVLVWMRKTFSKWGLQPVKVFTNWKKSDYDKLQKHRKKKEMISEKRDIDTQAELDELDREYQLSKEKQEKKHDLELEEVKKKGEVAKEKKSTELDIEDEEFEQRIEHEKAKHEVAQSITEDQIETALEATEKMKDIDVDKFERTTLAEEELEKEHKQEMKEMDVEAEKERVRKGVESTDERLEQIQEEIHELEMKMADSPPEKIEKLQPILDRKKEQYEKMQEEGTKRQLGTVGGEAAEKYAEAEGEKHNMETYKEAEDRERKHQKEITSEASDMMESAKQENPDYVGGGSGQSSGVNVVNVEDGDKQTQQRSSPSGDICPNCGGDVQKGWEACPQCGEDLGNGQNRCPNCGGDIKEGWEACPQCGEALGRGSQNKCPNCGEEIESDWKVCPGCGNVL